MKTYEYTVNVTLTVNIRSRLRVTCRTCDAMLSKTFGVGAVDGNLRRLYAYTYTYMRTREAISIGLATTAR